MKNVGLVMDKDQLNFDLNYEDFKKEIKYYCNSENEVFPFTIKKNFEYELDLTTIKSTIDDIQNLDFVKCSKVTEE
jgi:hypothetical protein